MLDFFYQVFFVIGIFKSPLQSASLRNCSILYFFSDQIDLRLIFFLEVTFAQCAEVLEAEFLNIFQGTERTKVVQIQVSL